MNINIRKVQLLLFKMLIIILPYHYMVICILGKGIPILKYWKEAIIILMLILHLTLQIRERKLYKLKAIDVISIFIFFVLVVYIIISEDMYSALYMARVYFLPILLIPIVSHMEIDKIQIKKILYLLAINSIILSVWGIIQSIFLGDQFLIKIGYDHYFNKDLGYERLHPSFYISGVIKFQRLTSTFVAPNTCAMYLSIIFTLILYSYKKIEMNKMLFYISIGTMSIAILLTFSRSTWIAWGLSIFIYMIKYVKFTKNSLMYMGISVISIIIVVFLIDILILDSTIITIGSHLISNTLSFKDSSMIGHIDSLQESFELFTKNIWGLGLGKNGPRAISLLGESNTNLTESSYFLILYDIGIIGFIIYFWSYIKIIRDNRKIRKKQNIKELIVVSIVVLMFLVSYIFLPYVQEFELLVMLYIIVGIQYNDKLIDKFYKEQ